MSDAQADGNTVVAPWPPEQVKHLNTWQTAGYLHPFTCPNRGDHTGEGDLVATPDGWVCSQCDYTQDWAYRQMVEPLPPNPVWESFQRSVDREEMGLE